MTYYILNEEEKIVLFDEDKQKLENTLLFTPQFSKEDIKTTTREIVEFEGNYYFATSKEYKDLKTKADAEKLARYSLTKREVFLAIYQDKGITPEQIRAQISTEEGKIEFDYANDYFRGNPLIDQIGLALGYTTEQLNYLFENGCFEE